MHVGGAVQGDETELHGGEKLGEAIAD